MRGVGGWSSQGGSRYAVRRQLPTGETIETMPMMTGADGVIRVSGTRVTLDSILLAFNEGAIPEEIAQQYPTVPLADIYHLIGYCLRHRAEMEEYLRRRLRESQEVQQQNEARWRPDGIRQRPLARRLNRACADHGPISCAGLPTGICDRRPIANANLSSSPPANQALAIRPVAIRLHALSEWRRESGQSGRGHVAAGFVQNKARGSALRSSFKGDQVVSHPSEEVLLAFGKKFKLR